MLAIDVYRASAMYLAPGPAGHCPRWAHSLDLCLLQGQRAGGLSSLGGEGRGGELGAPKARTAPRQHTGWGATAFVLGARRDR